jgi:hypothetical protein
MSLPTTLAPNSAAATIRDPDPTKGSITKDPEETPAWKK